MLKLAEIKKDPFFQAVTELGAQGQQKLAWRLIYVEAIRIVLIFRQQKLDKATKKNVRRWKDLRLDIEHFDLIQNAKD